MIGFSVTLVVCRPFSNRFMPGANGACLNCGVPLGLNRVEIRVRRSDELLARVALGGRHRLREDVGHVLEVLRCEPALIADAHDERFDLRDLVARDLQAHEHFRGGVVLLERRERSHAAGAGIEDCSRRIADRRAGRVPEAFAEIDARGRSRLYFTSLSTGSFVASRCESASI